uniref:Mono-/di-acylglycerol lipase N-terminal domain-containing protein n=1 Tax=Ananas comosus var. bracteatus TaxID=296719 RepID=A0A6V7PYF6_ANACO|nr:unnamed protein product [Ananas comosus var. bracteatus]
MVHHYTIACCRCAPARPRSTHFWSSPFPFSIFVSTIVVVAVVDDVCGGWVGVRGVRGCSRWAWKRLNYVGAYDSESWPLSSAAEFASIPRACWAILGVYADDLVDTSSTASSLWPGSSLSPLMLGCGHGLVDIFTGLEPCLT